MAVLPQFQDPGPPAYANSFFGGMSQGLSIVERKQRMRLNEQQAELEQAKFVAHLPLLQAQAENERVSAAAAIANATIQTQNAARAAVESVTAQKEFNAAAQYYAPRTYRVLEDGSLEDNPTEDKEAARATLEARLEMLRGLSVKYAYMKDLKDPGFSGFYEIINKTFIQTNEALHADLKMAQLLEAQRMMTDRAIATRTIGADASRDVADTNAAAKVESAEIGAESRVDTAKIRTQRTYELETTMKLREEARKRRDVEAFAIYDARLKKLNHIPQSAGEAVANALAEPTEAGTPEAATPKPPTTRDPYIRGTIYKDPKGKRARYLGNGQWQPLE